MIAVAVPSSEPPPPRRAVSPLVTDAPGVPVPVPVPVPLRGCGLPPTATAATTAYHTCAHAHTLSLSSCGVRSVPLSALVDAIAAIAPPPAHLHPPSAACRNARPLTCELGFSPLALSFFPLSALTVHAMPRLASTTPPPPPALVPLVVFPPPRAAVRRIAVLCIRSHLVIGTTTTYTEPTTQLSASPGPVSAC